MIKVFRKIKNIDYRHYICLSISAVFIALMCTLFYKGILRIGESFVDLWQSLKIYFCFIFDIETQTPASVLEYSKYFTIQDLALPIDFEEFKIKWYMFWDLFVDGENFNGYMLKLSKVLLKVSQYLTIFAPLIICLVIILKRNNRKQNNKFNKKTVPLKIFLKIVDYVILPVVRWVKRFITFIKENGAYWRICVFVWAINFNFISIFVEFLAFYFYFVSSFDFLTLYIQVCKLLIDLSVMFKTMPVITWFIVGFVVFDIVRKNIAFSLLEYYERLNRKFIDSRPLCTMNNASMGKQKTTLLTSMVLSLCIMFREKALELLIKNDMKFPNFPWINLENCLKKAMERHEVYNLATTKRFIRKLSRYYNYALKRPDFAPRIKKYLNFVGADTGNNFLFDYETERYSIYYDNKLEVQYIWEVIETYSQLYFIYVINSSYVLSNYSIRVDNEKQDIGNFPLWNNELFRVDSKTQTERSKYAHIVDFDALRLGKKILDNDEYANSFEFGLVAITEIGKERGNQVENIDKKKSAEETNQKNDMFNERLKMCRHSATVDNFPFVRFITDEQRSQSLGADARELCDIIGIKEVEETKLAMPFFAVGELLYSFTFGKHVNTYVEYRFNRSDTTLFMYLYHNATALIHNYYTRIYNRFGYHNLLVQTQSGTQDGEIKNEKYRIIHIKDYSKRFSTDCFSGVFDDMSVRSKYGLNDLPTYKTVKATFEEMQLQNSYFVRNLMGIKDKNIQKVGD